MELDVIAVVGLGYVGLPLAVEFGKKYPTLGYDLSETKIASYRNYCDPSGEISSDELRAATGLTLSAEPSILATANFIIVAVPTPVNEANKPDFSPLISASITVGKHLKAGAIVVYESTVYPGATEEVCIPILERESGLTWQRDFHIGYSPERINPGDKEHTLTKIIKIVSGDNAATLHKIAHVYSNVITAGVYCASSIKVAEAAKVIENTQRDLNIALMNELAIIFNFIGIDTLEVLKAAGTKWNFLPFRPGLVGGHCIGVDPYYLTHKAEMLGYHPNVILAGRRINDGMPQFIAHQISRHLVRTNTFAKTAKIIVLGLTFKENCSDLRNSKVADMIVELQDFGYDVSVHDPVASSANALREYAIELVEWQQLPEADVIVVAVAHEDYLVLPQTELLAKLKPGGLFVDIKSVYDPITLEAAGYNVWRL